MRPCKIQCRAEGAGERILLSLEILSSKQLATFGNFKKRKKTSLDVTLVIDSDNRKHVSCQSVNIMTKDTVKIRVVAQKHPTNDCDVLKYCPSRHRKRC